MMERQPDEEGGYRRSVPERLGQYLYYTRRDEGKGYPVYVRRPWDGTVEEEQVVSVGLRRFALQCTVDGIVCRAG